MWVVLISAPSVQAVPSLFEVMNTITSDTDRVPPANRRLIKCVSRLGWRLKMFRWHAMA